MSRRERLLDLAVSRATEGLTHEESIELDGALDELTDIGADDLELAAAAAGLAFAAAEAAGEPMPLRLREKILEQGRTCVASREPAAAPLREPGKRDRGVFDTRYLGWYAAAAMLVLALWSPWSSKPGKAGAPPTPAEQRSLLIENAEDVIRVAWSPPEIEAYSQVEGDVVWSDREQAGFLRLRGLPVNRAAVEQYQLWIVDPSRDERPIDGGVFDIPSGVDEVIVPIDAKLRADKPTVFAITLEQPGGVVVSDGPLLVIAAVDA